MLGLVWRSVAQWSESMMCMHQHRWGRGVYTWAQFSARGSRPIAIACQGFFQKISQEGAKPGFGEIWVGKVESNDMP